MNWSLSIIRLDVVALGMFRSPPYELFGVLPKNLTFLKNPLTSLIILL